MSTISNVFVDIGIIIMKYWTNKYDIRLQKRYVHQVFNKNLFFLENKNILLLNDERGIFASRS